MVLEAWLARMGNHVSSNIKTALTLDAKKKGPKSGKPRIGILSFEVANVMSKAVQLWQSLSEQEILRLRNEVIKSEGVWYLVSEDEGFLLGLACAEKLEDLAHVAAAVSRLGKKCQEPALQGFEHVYNDVLKKNIDIGSLEFLDKDMDRKVKKMERYIAATASLYQEVESLTDLEHSARKMQVQQAGDGRVNGQKDGSNLYAIQQKILWHRHEIKHLQDVSLWNQTYDKVVGLLARTVCTIYGRICSVFGSPVLGLPEVSLPSQLYDDDVHRFSTVSGPLSPFPRSSSVTSRGGYNQSESREIRFSSGPLERHPVVEVNSGHRSGPILSRTASSKVRQNRDLGLVGSLRTGTRVLISGGSSPGRLFKDCLSLNGNYSPKLQDSHVESVNCVASNYKSADSSCNMPFGNCEMLTKAAVAHSGNGFHPVSQSESIIPPSGHLRQTQSGPIYNNSHNAGSNFGPKCKLMNAPSSTLGGAALALHYANVIILVEKLVQFPHLISQDARDDLYQMLPTSVRKALRSRLKSYAKNLASAVYDAPLAADWKDALERILGWLAPLAHNMIRWQSEHNFEQQQVVSRTNVLLLQTLYFADQAKTEATITELLVGLNYICRYEQELRANTLLECGSSQDYDEYLEWQL